MSKQAANMTAHTIIFCGECVALDEMDSIHYGG